MAWETLTAAQYTAGRLVTPEWVYNHMERDWELFFVPTDFHIASEVATTGGETFEVVVCFPDSWALDTTLDSAAQLRLSLWIHLQTSISLETGSLAFTTNSVQSGTGTFAGIWRQLIRYWDGTLPTGPTAVELTFGAPTGGATCTASRSAGTGPDSGYYFTF